MANDPTYIECICIYRKGSKECGFISGTRKEMKRHIVSSHYRPKIANHTSHYYRLRNPEAVQLSWKARFSHWLNQENERKAQEKMAASARRGAVDGEINVGI